MGRWATGQTRSTLGNLCGKRARLVQEYRARNVARSCGHEPVEHGQWDVNRINIPFCRCAKLFPDTTLIGGSARDGGD